MLMLHPTSGLLLATPSGLLANDIGCCCDTAPCPACVDVAATLYGKFTAKTGDATSLPDDFTLIQVGFGPSYLWDSPFGSYAMPCHGASAYLTMECQDDCHFRIFPAASFGQFNGSATGATLTVTRNADPLILEANVTITPAIPSTCSGTVHIEIRDVAF